MMSALYYTSKLSRTHYSDCEATSIYYYSPFYSLWLDSTCGSNPRSIALVASTLTITPPIGLDITCITNTEDIHYIDDLL